LALRVTPLFIVAALAGVVATLLAFVEVDLAYEKPGLRVALETAAALIATVVAYLLAGRFRRSGKLSDVVLAAALAVFALSNLWFGALPTAAFAEIPEVALWAWVGGHVLGAALFAAAAFVPPLHVRRRGRVVVGAFVGAAGTLGLLLGMLALAPEPPATVERPAGAGGAVDLTSHPLVVAAHIVTTVAFAAAAVGFARRREGTGDAFLHWVAAGAILAAFARLDYAFHPSLYSSWVYTGDVFRLLFYVCLLGGAAREIAGYWRGLADAAVLEERRRMARDLHDGAAQELAFIVRRARRLAAATPGDELAQLAAAAQRALDDSRRAIAALVRPVDEPLDVALAAAAEDVAARTGAHVALDLESGADASPDVREALLRIATEAVGNAARHAHADVVRVELEAGRPLRLRVVDDGAGFDVSSASASNTRFGLTSMRDRAARIGAELEIRSAPGHGTEVRVLVR
jgi:signal transduction histidine kinase